MVELVRDRIARPDTLGDRRRGVRGSGRAASPFLRPAAGCPTPTIDRHPVMRARSCVMPEPAAPLASPTTASQPSRLTDRGIAVVLVVGLMIMVAALTVVGLTAMKVTGDGYRGAVTATLPR